MVLSLIIPIYNAETFLPRLFENLEAQGVFFDDKEVGEAIFVIDGSPDNSEMIIRDYQSLHPWVKIIKQTNQGQHIARNKGIKAAKGDYIVFMDQDDAYSPLGLRVLLDAVSLTNGEVVKGKAIMLENNSFETWKLQDVKSLQIKDVILGHQYILRTNGIKDLLSDTIWGAIYNKNFLLENGILFEEECRVHEDGVFNWKLMSVASKVVLLDNMVYNWIQRPDSDFHNKTFSHIMNRRSQRISLCIFYNKLVMTLEKQKGIPNEVIEILRRDMLWELYPYLGTMVKLRGLRKDEIKPTIKRLKEEGVYPYPHSFPKNLPEGYPTSLQYKVMWWLMSYEWILKLMLRLRAKKD